MKNKFYWGIGALFILLIIGATVFVFSKNKEKIRQSEAALKNVQDFTDNSNPRKSENRPPPGKSFEGGGHWHGDEWHDEPHSELKSSELRSAIGREKNKSTEEEFLSEYDRLITEVAQLKKTATQLKKTIANLQKEHDTYTDVLKLRNWVNKNLPEIKIIGENLKPLSGMSKEDFSKKYPNVEDRKPIIESLQRLEKFRSQYVSLIENASPGAKRLFYTEMVENGYEAQYQKMLQPAWIDSQLMKLLQ